MSGFKAIESIAEKCGFTEYGYVRIDHLKYYPDIRKICEGNTCRNYGSCWACPPAVGTLEECKNRVEQYDNMMLFTKKYETKNSFDIKGMMRGLKDFKKLADSFHEELKPCLSDFMLLSNEGCGRCKECTYPDEPCRFPDLLHHSLEGYGFLVNDLAKEANVKYNNGQNTVTYFGALLFNTEETETDKENGLDDDSDCQSLR